MAEEEDNSNGMQEAISEYASVELEMNLKDYEERVVQKEQDALGVVYFPRELKKDIVFISCKDTQSGLQIGNVSGSFYAINKVFRKLGIAMPRTSKV